MSQVQVLTLEYEVEWEGPMDDLIQGNADLTETQLRWIENLEVGEEMRVPGGMEGGFFVRRLT